MNAVKLDVAAEMLCPVSAGNEHSYKCEGAGCMGWRWEDGASGYCGMAGNILTLPDLAKVAANMMPGQVQP